MRRNFLIHLLLAVIFSTTHSTWAQQDTNTYDQDGKRHGHWKEYFENSPSNLKFEGNFVHGKKSGLFKFYQEGLKQPVAIMDFDPSSQRAKARYLTQKGRTISEGEIINEKRNGLWTYYHKNSDKVMMTENYKDGKLHGKKEVFYDNGEVAEEATYVNGELHGSRKLYSVKGVVLEDLTYRHGELHGPARFYNGKGELMSEGNYRNNKHHGTWKYYENGKLKEEKDF